MRSNAYLPFIAAIVSKEAENIFSDLKVYQSNQKLAKFNMFIEQHFKEEKLVPFYASKLHISANYLKYPLQKTPSCISHSIDPATGSAGG